jgi:hypothetical protein
MRHEPAGSCGVCKVREAVRLSHEDRTSQRSQCVLASPGLQAPAPGFDLLHQLIAFQFSQKPIEVRRVEQYAAGLGLDGLQQTVAMERSVHEREKDQIVARLEWQQRSGIGICHAHADGRY